LQSNVFNVLKSGSPGRILTPSSPDPRLTKTRSAPSQSQKPTNKFPLKNTNKTRPNPASPLPAPPNSSPTATHNRIARWRYRSQSAQTTAPRHRRNTAAPVAVTKKSHKRIGYETSLTRADEKSGSQEWLLPQSGPIANRPAGCHPAPHKLGNRH